MWDFLDEFYAAPNPEALADPPVLLAPTSGDPGQVRDAYLGATAEELARYGLSADLIPSEEFQAEGVIEALRHVGVTGQRILIPRAAVAREILPEQLRALGADVQVARRAGLLHDLGKAIDFEVEGPHAVIGADILRRNRESAPVIHAVEAQPLGGLGTDQRYAVRLDPGFGSQPGRHRRRYRNLVRRHTGGD